MQRGRWFWVATVVPAVLAVALVGGGLALGEPGSLRTATASAAIAVAIFAVNFAALEYQVSKYRPLLGPVASEHRDAGIALIAIAFCPLGLMMFGELWADVLALLLLVGVCGGAAVLPWAVATWSGPDVQLELRRRPAVIAQTMVQLQASAEEALLARSKVANAPDEVPMHEWGLHPEPDPIRDSAIDFAEAMGLMALESRDTHTYNSCLKLLVEFWQFSLAIEVRSETDGVPDYEIQSVLKAYTLSRLEGFVAASVAQDSSGLARVRTVELLGGYLAELSAEFRARSGHRELSDLIGSVAVPGSSVPRRRATTLAIAGLRRSGVLACTSVGDDTIEQHELGVFPATLKRIGKDAVEAGDNHGVHRVVEALGWMGCSAIKKDRYAMVKECVNAIVVVGRRARAAGLECFWSGCALTIADHANQNLEWIASWLTEYADDLPSKADSSNVGRGSLGIYERVLSQGLSRLHGRAVEVELGANGREIKAAVKSEPYREGFMGDGGTRTLDYSDFSMIEELRL